MVRLIASLFIGILLLIFSSQNLHQVWVRFVAGPPVQLPMIVVIAGAFVGGYVLATLSHIARSAKKMKKKGEESPSSRVSANSLVRS